MPRLSPLHAAWACVVLAASSSTFAAPQIWRCGNNSYSDLPCEGGRPLGSGAPTPSAEQRQQADEGMRKDQAAADRMQRERLRLEATASRSATVIGPAPREEASKAQAATVIKSGKKKRTEKPDDFVASTGKPPAKGRKSRRD